MPVSGFDGRLNLLEASGQVTRDARVLTAQYICEVEREFSVTLTEGNASQLVTHLAMGLTRLIEGRPETHAPDGLKAEVSQHRAELQFTRRVLSEYGATLGKPVPESEFLYMTAHLCVLTQRDEG